MNKLTSIITLLLTLALMSACGREPLPNASCEGVLDGIKFTYTYEGLDKAGIGGYHYVKTTCTNDDPEAKGADGAMLFEFVDRAEHRSNVCVMDGDYAITWTGGATASVTTWPGFDGSTTQPVGEITCQ